MAKYFLLIISVFFLISCRNNSQSFDLIPKESFKSILIKIETSNNQDSVLLDSILIDHQASKEMYEQTLMFYINQPEQMRIFLQEIKDSLST